MFSFLQVALSLAFLLLVFYLIKWTYQLTLNLILDLNGFNLVYFILLAIPMAAVLAIFFWVMYPHDNYGDITDGRQSKQEQTLSYQRGVSYRSRPEQRTAGGARAPQVGNTY